jgi:hypothetical protein
MRKQQRSSASRWQTARISSAPSSASARPSARASTIATRPTGDSCRPAIATFRDHLRCTRCDLADSPMLSAPPQPPQPARSPSPAMSADSKAFDELYLAPDAAVKPPYVNATRYLVGGELVEWKGDFSQVRSPILVRGSAKHIIIGQAPTMTEREALAAVEAAHRACEWRWRAGAERVTWRSLTRVSRPRVRARSQLWHGRVAATASRGAHCARGALRRAPAAEARRDS